MINHIVYVLMLFSYNNNDVMVFNIARNTEYWYRCVYNERIRNFLRTGYCLTAITMTSIPHYHYNLQKT